MARPLTYAEPPIVVGVDVGGTKIAASLVDARGRLFGKIRHLTDISSSEATLDSIAAAVNQVIRSGEILHGDIQAIGVGIPGMVDHRQGIGIASVNLNWNDVSVKEGLENRLDLPCTIENDVKAAGLGEAIYGAGKGKQNLIFITIGTGIAAAVILDNKIYRGPNGLAGEIGHAVIERNGPLCKCGGYGCLEALASGPAITARAVQKIQSGRSSIICRSINDHNRFGLSTQTVSTKTVFEAANEGDEVALETIEEVSQYIAYAIQLISLAYDPQVVVLGGGVSQSGDLLLSPVTTALRRYADDSWVFRKMFSPDFLQITKLGSDIGVLGAAALIVAN